MRPLWVGTSWKMTKRLAEACDYAARLASAAPGRWPGVQPFVLPPVTALQTVRTALGDSSPVMVGAQNLHWEDGGPWTGEVSAPQLAELGVEIVEIGHSERREHFGETDATVNLKVKAALRHGLRPLVCVGEDARQRRDGVSAAVVLDQLAAALDGIDDPGDVVVAYEPVWAIGAGGRPALPGEIAPVMTAVSERYGHLVDACVYGGSVDAGNAAALLAVPGNGGLFVGRAAWDVVGLVRILDLAAHTLR